MRSPACSEKPGLGPGPWNLSTPIACNARPNGLHPSSLLWGGPLFHLSQCLRGVNLLCWIKTDAIPSLQTPGLQVGLCSAPGFLQGSVSLGLGFPVHLLTPGPPPEQPGSRNLPGPSFPGRPRLVPSPTAHPTPGSQLDACTPPPRSAHTEHLPWTPPCQAHLPGSPDNCPASQQVHASRDSQVQRG